MTTSPLFRFFVKFIPLSSLVFLTACSSWQTRTPQSEPPLRRYVEALRYDTGVPLVNSVTLRSGYVEPPAGTELRGCVLYLQGLGDSVMNHDPYFRALSEAGYRVLFFDYMGQGGSSGSMNHTRLYDPVYRKLEIVSQADAVWNRYAGLQSAEGRTCAAGKKIVIGWSTGGLASYRMASRGQADAVVLIAPGINPKTLVGEAALKPSLLASSEPVITERTLTRRDFRHERNPHVDPVKPVSPTRVPLFAANLLLTSNLAQKWRIPPQVQGLVFLSGNEDTYVDRDASVRTLGLHAPHFSVISYDGARHELDNETEDVAADLRRRSVEFLNRVNGR